MKLGVIRIALTVCVDETETILFCVAILLNVLVRTLVKRWSSDVEVTFLNDLWHEAEEERHYQSVDVRTIDVGIGHDDDLVVAQLLDVCLLGVRTVYTETYTDSLKDDVYRLRLEHLVPLYLLNVKDLTTKRKNCLSITVTSLLC